jgi:hypothetical protein
MIERFISWVMNIRGSNAPFVCIYMTRLEYLKYFAYDKNGCYIGREPQRSWTKKELELDFGQYQDAHPRKWVRNQVGGRVFMVEEKC